METHIQFNKITSFWNNASYSNMDIYEAQRHSGGLWIMKQKGSNIVGSILDVYRSVISMKLTVGDMQVVTNAWQAQGSDPLNGLQCV